MFLRRSLATSLGMFSLDGLGGRLEVIKLIHLVLTCKGFNPFRSPWEEEQPNWPLMRFHWIYISGSTLIDKYQPFQQLDWLLVLQPSPLFFQVQSNFLTLLVEISYIFTVT
jgi:hypothetical protein